MKSARRKSLLLGMLALLASACSSEPEGGAASATSHCEEPGTICSVAGTGAQDFNGDGLAPTETAFNLPSSVHVGPDGLLYITDFNNMRVRCIMPDGTIDTVVGNGVHAQAIEGADALSTPLENPMDFGFTGDGRLLLVSLHDPRVLRLEHDRTLSTIIGTGEPGDSGDEGPASEATFGELSAIAVGDDGSVFVSDFDYHRVRVMRPDGTVHAYAGTGEKGSGGDGGLAAEAELFHPQGLSLDAEGNLYVADTFNHRIRRVDAKTGLIETVAGTETLGFSGDGGPATEAELQWPNGVSVAPDGQIYIADTFNHRIRQVALDGTITTIAGSTQGLSGDGGPATLAQLNGPSYLEATEDALYLADMRNQVVRVVRLPAP